MRPPGRRTLPVGVADADGHGRDVEWPAAIPGRGWRDILRRVRRVLARDHLWLAAAGVAFWALFAAIPGTAVVIAAYGLVADPGEVHRQLGMTRGLLPGVASEFLAEEMEAIAAASRLRLGAGLGGALLVALWSARAGVATLIGACNIAYRERERRGFVRYQAVALAVTAAACLFGLVALALIAVPPIAADALPLGSGARAAVSFARWPMLAAMMAVALAALYRFAPCRRRPKWRWVSVGATVAAALWLAGSAGFSYYVARFPSYNATFGVLGAMMLLLSWFYLTAFAVLLGAEVNAELERQTARDTTEGPARPPGRRGARVADTVG